MKMKRLLLVMLVLFAFQQIEAQEERFIEVTGSADVVVQPDEIELEIIIKEYYSRDFFKKGTQKYQLGDVSDGKETIQQIEGLFFQILEQNSIPKSSVVINDQNNYWYYWWAYRNENIKRKRFSLKLSNETDFLKLVQSLDQPWVQSLRVSNTSNKKLQSLRKEVKIAAMKAAKEKAAYLLESIDEKVGRIISVQEVSDNYSSYRWRGNQNLVSNVSVQSNRSSDEFDQVTSITLRYQIKAKFEIQ
jgi:hypothetical protein